jgi:hypothetical protein
MCAQRNVVVKYVEGFIKNIFEPLDDVIKRSGREPPKDGLAPSPWLGTDVMILKKLRKNLANKFAFFCSKYGYFLRKIDHDIVFLEKNAIFSPKIGKNRKKLWS